MDTKNKVRIVFCLPGKMFSNNFLLSWTDMIGKCILNNIDPVIINRTDSNVYYVRNKCLCGDLMKGKKQEIFNGLDYDYIMWIDSDQVFEFNNLVSLLNRNLDVVSGIYLMDPGKLYAVVEKWDKEFFRKNGYFKFLSIEDVQNYKKNDNTLLEVAYSGLGFMLIKKNVIEKIDYPWFSPIWEEFTPEIEEFMSEDVAFCQKLIKNNIKVHVDLNVIVGHEKSKILK